MIRTVRPSDGPELVRMRVALWPDSEAAEVDDLLGRSPSSCLVLVAEREEGGLAGFAEVGSRDHAEGCTSSPVAYLEGIWVDADRRRAGVALDLVRHAEAWARARGFTELASDAVPENAASLAFHAAAGFHEVERVVCFRRALRPAAASPEVELIFFEGCPYAGTARSHLREALSSAGLEPSWTEWDVLRAETPADRKEHPSPTVLVRGRDVMGPGAPAAAGACRAQGAPSVETIARALRAPG